MSIDVRPVSTTPRCEQPASSARRSSASSERGALYDFHQISGHADLLVAEAIDLFDEAGHDRWAECVRDELLGRDVIPGRWTFQIVEDYDATYWECARSIRSRLEADLLQGRTHVHEAEMKGRRRTDA